MPELPSQERLAGVMLFGPLLLPEQKSIPATWASKGVPVFVCRSRSDDLTKRHIVMYNLWAQSAAVTVHIVDRRDVMIRDASDARAFFTFLSPLVCIPSALEDMAAKGEVHQVHS